MHGAPARPQPLDHQPVRRIDFPVLEHVPDEELERRPRGPDVIRAVPLRITVDEDLERAVRLEDQPRAVEDVDGVPIGVPEREVVLRESVFRDPTGDPVAFVPGDRDRPVHGVGVVHAPARSGDAFSVHGVREAGDADRSRTERVAVRAPDCGREHHLLEGPLEAPAHVLADRRVVLREPRLADLRVRSYTVA